LLFSRYSTFNPFSTSFESSPRPSVIQPEQKRSQPQPPSQQPSPLTRADTSLPGGSNDTVIKNKNQNSNSGASLYRRNPNSPRATLYPPLEQHVSFQSNKSTGGDGFSAVPSSISKNTYTHHLPKSSYMQKLIANQQQPPSPHQQYGQKSSLPSTNFQNNPRIDPKNVNYRGNNPNNGGPTNNSRPKWSQEEYNLLAKAVSEVGTRWETISRDYFNRFKSARACSEAWARVLAGFITRVADNYPVSASNPELRFNNTDQMPQYNMPSNPGPMPMPISESNSGQQFQNMPSNFDQMPRYNSYIPSYPGLMLMPTPGSNPGQLFDNMPPNPGQIPRYSNNMPYFSPMPITMQISESNPGQRFVNMSPNPGQIPRHSNNMPYFSTTPIPMQISETNFGQRFANMPPNTGQIPRYSNNIPYSSPIPMQISETNPGQRYDDMLPNPGQMPRYNNNISSNPAPMATPTINMWTSDEIDRLRKGVEKYGKDYFMISSKCFRFRRTPLACQLKYERIENLISIAKFKSYDKTKTGKTNKSDSLDVRLGELLDKKLQQITSILGKPAEKIQIMYYTPSSSSKAWTKKENNILFESVKEFGDNWPKILERLPGRTLTSAKNRYGDVVWTLKEITAFEEAISKYGQNWAKIAENVTTKTAGQCWSYWRRSTGADLNESEDSSANPHQAHISILFPEGPPMALKFIRHHKWEIFTQETNTIASTTKLNNPNEENGKLEDDDQNALYIFKGNVVKPIDEKDINNIKETTFVYSEEEKVEKEQGNLDLKGQDNDLFLENGEDLKQKEHHELGGHDDLELKREDDLELRGEKDMNLRVQDDYLNLRYEDKLELRSEDDINAKEEYQNLGL
ncbi:2552_t:CDS:2, partial [Ambispora leptoticha]